MKNCSNEIRSNEIRIRLELPVVRNVFYCQASLKPLFRIDAVKIYERVPLEKVPRFWQELLEKQTRDDTRKTADQRKNAWTSS